MPTWERLFEGALGMVRCFYFLSLNVQGGSVATRGDDYNRYGRGDGMQYDLDLRRNKNKIKFDFVESEWFWGWREIQRWRASSRPDGFAVP
jgi:hypothetical protein